MKKILEMLVVYYRSLVPHKKNVATAIGVFVALFLLFQCAPARAEGVESRFDLGYRVLRGQSAALHYSVGLEKLTPTMRPIVGLGLIGASNDPSYGRDDNNGFMYAGIETCRRQSCLLLGGGGFMRETVYSGTRMQFVLGLRFHVLDLSQWRIDAGWLHLSNSGIKKPNPGFDMPSISFVRKW